MVGFGGCQSGSEGLGWFSFGFGVGFRELVVGNGGVLVWNGGLRDWFVLFQCWKRKRTPCDVPKIKMKKSNTGSTNLFLLFSFRRLRGAKVVFFCWFPGLLGWFFVVSIRVLRVCSVRSGVFMFQMRLLLGWFRCFYGSFRRMRGVVRVVGGRVRGLFYQHYDASGGDEEGSDDGFGVHGFV